MFTVPAWSGNLGTRLTDRLNGILLPLLSSLSDGGVYMVGYFISEAMDAPRKAISRIISPLISEKWSLGKLAEIEDLYKKSALNQLIVGLALLLAVWVSVDDLFRIMPNGEAFSRGKYVILLLGIARLVDMATGVNTEILSFTSHYRYNFYLTIFLGVFNLAANLLLIPIYKLNGAALAALLSVTAYNLLKFFVLRWKMRIQPFSVRMVLAVSAAGVAWLAVSWLPEFDSAFLGVLVKSPVALAIFGGLVLGLKISPEVNGLASNLWSKINRR
ncbi:MAG: polysaccharide biosynthesis C-terminal domain-containing protein [Bacteroidota bacterium]